MIAPADVLDRAGEWMADRANRGSIDERIEKSQRLDRAGETTSDRVGYVGMQIVTVATQLFTSFLVLVGFQITTGLDLADLVAVFAAWLVAQTITLRAIEISYIRVIEERSQHQDLAGLDDHLDDGIGTSAGRPVDRSTQDPPGDSP